MTSPLPRHQYTASNASGRHQTSRFSANDDIHARILAARLLGGNIPDGVRLWEIIPGSPETFREVPRSW